MKIIGIETSCDETAVSVVEVKNNKFKVLSNVVSSQVKLHAKYGGVVPHLAAREHEKNLPRVLKLAIQKAGVKNIKNEIIFIAVTVGPGLSPALWRGVNFAKELAEKYKIPLLGVNHLEGHIYSNWLPPIAKTQKSKVKSKKFRIIFPALNLIISGGHTMLVLMRDYGKYKVIGETLDDAVGEAFDKVARLLNLGYPGGPQIARHAEQFARNHAELTRTNAENISVNPRTNQRKSALGEFPRPMINSKDYNFSYSGLKTAVLYKLKDLRKNKIKLTKNLINQICYEFQKAAMEVLVVKTIKAAKEFKVKSILLSGGVSANKFLREELEKETNNLGLFYAQPPMEYTTDNASMIALAGYFKYLKKKKTDLKSVTVDANLKF